MNRAILLILILSYSSGLKSQVNLDSLFSQIDSLTFYHIDNPPEEYIDEGFYQSFCHESKVHFTTNSKELINSTFQYLDFKESSEVLFCGYDFKVEGFKQSLKLFEMDFNSKCNFASIGYDHYWTDSLGNLNVIFKNYIRFIDSNCTFQNQNLLDCYIESLKKDSRIEILRIRKEDLELYYSFKIK
jgi:hypothetical protein